MSFVDEPTQDSGLTSRPRLAATNIPPSEHARFKAEGTQEDEVPTSFRSKVENYESDGPSPVVLASSNQKSSRKTQSWDAHSWSGLTFFSNDTLATRGKPARSCNGHLESCTPRSPSPKTSQRVPLPTTPKTSSSRKTSPKGKHFIDDEANDIGSELPILNSSCSTSSELSDDDGNPFDTPKFHRNGSSDQFTPLTPSSAYATPGAQVDKEDGSPTNRGRHRPLPEPLQCSNREAEILCGNFPILQKTAQNEAKSRDKSINSWISIDHSSSAKDSNSNEDNPSNRARVKTKHESETTGSHDTQRDDTPLSLRSSTLVNGIDILKEIFGDKVVSRFEANPKHCLAENKSPVKGRVDGTQPLNRAHEKHAREHLRRLDNSLPVQKCITELEALVERIFSGRCHLKDAKAKLLAWRLSYQGTTIVREVCHDLQKDRSNDPEIAADICSQVDKLNTTKDQDVIPPHVKKAVKISYSHNFKFCASRPRTRATKYETTIKRCIPWQPIATAHLSVKDCLLKCIHKPFTTQEESRGYLYLYATNGDFGAEKIGVTKNPDIQKRMDGWRRKCRRNVNLLYPKDNEKVAIPHVYRLEKLIHAELKDYRVLELGCLCAKRKQQHLAPEQTLRRSGHREWFRAPHPHIMAVVERWTKWMMQEPWEKKGGVWSLRDGFENLDAICTPYTHLNNSTITSPQRVRGPRRVAVPRAVTQSRRSPRLARLYPRRSARIAAQ